MPYNVVRTSHSKTNCRFSTKSKHKYKIETRECKGHEEDIGGDVKRLHCPVEYKEEFCEECGEFRIQQANEHSIQCEDIIEDGLIHPEAEIVGIHPRVKIIINELISKNVQYLLPAQAHIYLNQESIRKSEMKGLPMPTKDQVAYYIRNYRTTNTTQSNKISDVLVSTCVYHLDCTYKLTKNRFPLLVFGVSDYSGQFHPIAYALLSHECGLDFEWFFNSLKTLTESLGIVLKPKYLMMDACDASWNAAAKVFPETTILMCYFHVKFNVKKHSKLVPKDALDSVNADIDSMHKTLTIEHFVQQRDLVMEKWTQLGYVEFRDYFIKEWLCEKFWRWQYFQVPCGLATTNSTIESYNKIIKLLYTNYIS